MQFYLDSTARLPERKLSPAGPFVPYRPVAAATPPGGTGPPAATATHVAFPLAEGAKTTVPAPAVVEDEVGADKGEAACGTTSDGTTTDSDEEDSDSLTTEASDIEVRNHSYSLRVFVFRPAHT